METHTLYKERDSPETTDERGVEVDALMVRISDGVEFTFVSEEQVRGTQLVP
jgi:hypothetical protein